MIFFLYLTSCDTPCQSAIGTGSSLVDLFRRLEQDKCFHPSDLDVLSLRMNEHHQKTTLHCDTIYRRSSIDGELFDGPEERWLDSASVADVFIDIDGSHVVAFNDLRPGLLLKTAETASEIFWQQGLVGFGGLGLMVESPGSTTAERILTNLNLETPQEVVDPDIRRSRDGLWKLVWFGVNPTQMNTEMPGPLASPKPHHFYQSESKDLRIFSAPELIIASTRGSTGGSDPAMLELDGGADVFFLGPLDITTMAWYREAGEAWDPLAEPSANTGQTFATPDAVKDPNGGYRLYGMKNGLPGSFWMSKSTDGKRWSRAKSVLEAPGAFNISVGVDPLGTWWAYYNRTDPDCLEKWGSKKVMPKGAPPVQDPIETVPPELRPPPELRR